MPSHPWHDVDLPRYVEDPIPAIIEIATGSKVKYELDKRSGLLLVDRILFSSVHYPANYGFVPRTYCDDGDPLDILVYCEEKIQPLSIMRAKVIGVMHMRDDKGQDDKLIAVHADDPNFVHYGDIAEFPLHRLRELKRFFEDYKALENKKVLVEEPQGRSEALEVLRGAMRLYDREKDRLIGDDSGAAKPSPRAQRVGGKAKDARPRAAPRAPARPSPRARRGR